jgi:hypothetical protein
VTNHNLFECNPKAEELHDVTKRLSKLSNIEFSTKLLVEEYKNVYARQIAPELQLLPQVNIIDEQNLTTYLNHQHPQSACVDRLERYKSAQVSIVNAITHKIDKNDLFISHAF